MAVNFGERFLADADPAVRTALDHTLSSFEVRLELVAKPMDDDQRRQIMETVHEGVFNRLLRLGLSRSHMGYDHDLYDDKGGRYRKRKEEDVWFKMSYSDPGSDFAINLSDSFISILVQGLPLREVVRLASAVFQDLLVHITSNSDTSRALQVDMRAHKVWFRFITKYRLGNYRVSRHGQGAAKNHEVLFAALGLEPPQGQPPQRYAPAETFHSLGLRPDSYVRIDYNQHAYKKIGDLAYKIVTRVEAPFNENSSILYVTCLLGSDDDFFNDGSGFHLDRSFDLEVPFMAFYRDCVLKLFLNNMLSMVEIRATEK